MAPERVLFPGVLDFDILIELGDLQECSDLAMRTREDMCESRRTMYALYAKTTIMTTLNLLSHTA
jgi:hypothetical protein